MDVDETQKLDDLNIIDQIKSKNGVKNGHEEQDKKFFLKFVKSNDDKQYQDTYTLKQGTNVIGRSDACDVVIQNPNLSKTHATIEINQSGYFIWDHATLNKTKKNGVDLKPNVHYELNQNDLLNFGNLEFSFSFASSKDEHKNGKDHVLDIPNTLEEDLLSSETVTRKNKGLVVADTDDEDGENDEFGDRSKVDLVNETIELIPETQDDEPVKTNGSNGHHTNGTNGHHKEEEEETIPVGETLRLEETLPIVERKEETEAVVVKAAEEVVAVCKENEQMVAKEKDEVVPVVEEKNEQVAIKPSGEVVEVTPTVVEMVNEETPAAAAEVSEPIVTEEDEDAVPPVVESETPKIVEIEEKTEVIVESTLLDQTTDKIEDEQNQTKIDGDVTLDDGTYAELKGGEEKPKRGRKKKETPEAEASPPKSEDDKRPTRSSRRSVAPPPKPQAETTPVEAATTTKRGARGGRGKKAAASPAAEEEKPEEVAVEEVAETTTTPVAEVEATAEEQPKVVEEPEKKTEEEAPSEEPVAAAEPKRRGRKSVAAKKEETPVEEKTTTPPKRGRGKKATAVAVEQTPEQEVAEPVVETTPPPVEASETETKKSRRKSTAQKKAAKVEEEEPAVAKTSADVYDHSESEEQTTPKQKGKRGAKAKATTATAAAVVEEEEVVPEKKQKRASRGKAAKEVEAEEEEEEAPAAAAPKRRKSTKATAAAAAAAADLAEKNTSTPQTNGNKNVFFQHSRSANKQIPTSSSSNTISNLDITNVSEITAKNETPRKKIKLSNFDLSDESDTELTATVTKKLKTINESPSRATAAAASSKGSAKKRASTSTATSGKRSKKSVNQSLNESIGSVTAANDTLNETSASTASKKQTAASKRKIIPRLSLNESTSSARHSSRNTKTGTQVKVITTGIMLSDREREIVEALGGQLVTDPKECTHLITNKIIKSCKFLSCLSRGVPIVTERWLEESYRARMFLNHAQFRLQDPDMERQLKITLERSLEKARSKPVLKLWKIFIDKSDLNETGYTFDDIKTMVESAQGEVVDKLAEKEDELIDYCILFANENNLKNYNGIGAADETLLLRMTIDTFYNCLLTQKFPPV